MKSHSEKHEEIAVRIANSLAFRLFCLLLLVSAIVFISLTTLIIRANTQHVMEEIILSAKRTNELLLRSMRQSMLLNRLEDVAQTVNTLSSAPGIDGIRIYGKKGSVVFSTEHPGNRAKVRHGHQGRTVHRVPPRRKAA